MNLRHLMAGGYHENLHSHLRDTGASNYIHRGCLHRLAHMESVEDLKKAALDQAWHEVLNEVYYTEQRHFEERKRVEDEHKRRRRC